jgi:hypothetical protein
LAALCRRWVDRRFGLALPSGCIQRPSMPLFPTPGTSVPGASFCEANSSDVSFPGFGTRVNRRAPGMHNPWTACSSKALYVGVWRATSALSAAGATCTGSPSEPFAEISAREMLVFACSGRPWKLTWTEKGPRAFLADGQPLTRQRRVKHQLATQRLKCCDSPYWRVRRGPASVPPSGRAGRTGSWPSEGCRSVAHG